MPDHERDDQWLAEACGPIPARCAVCGGPRVIRLLWDSVISECKPVKAAVDAGKALLVGSQPPDGAPTWACLDCRPDWLVAHRLTGEIKDLRLKKEVAVEHWNFQVAAHYRDLERDLRARQLDVVSGLL